MSIDEDEPVEIPDTPATRKAAVVLAAAPMDATSEQLDALIRRTATVTRPVRKALVEEEIARRANRQVEQVRAAMTEQHQHPRNIALEAEMKPAEPETKTPKASEIYRQALQSGKTPEEASAAVVRALAEQRGDTPEATQPPVEQVRIRSWQDTQNGEVHPLIPDTPQYNAVRQALMGTDPNTPEKQLYEVLRRAASKAHLMMTSEVRKSLVQEHLGRLQQIQSDTEAGTPDKPSQSREELQRRSDGQATHNRNTSRQKVSQLLTVLVVAIGIVAWFYHSHEVKRHAAEAVVAAAAAREQQARSIVASVRNSWNADDNWEDTFSSKGAYVTPYTIELENALMKGRPIVAFGLVGDVRKSGEQENSIVLIQDIGRTMKWDLRFSLLSAPAITKAILNDEDRQSNTFIIAATITSVEKVSMPPDEKDNDQDYFLAHGILHEAQPIGPFADPPHK